MKPSVVIALSSPKPSHEWPFGQQALRLLYKAGAGLQPERVGRDDSELRKKLPCASVEDIEGLWAAADEYQLPYGWHDGYPDTKLPALHWKRRRPLNASGTFTFASYHKVRNRTLPSRVSLLADTDAAIDYVDLFKGWCKLYQPHQGYVHFLTDEIRNEIRPNLTGMTEAGELQRRIRWFHEGFLGPLHEEKTLDLGCVNFFCLETLDQKTVGNLKAAGIHVEPFANGTLIILVADLNTLKQNIDGFVSKRKIAKSIIGAERFGIPD